MLFLFIVRPAGCFQVRTMLASVGSWHGFGVEFGSIRGSNHALF